ncbi:MAG TPA: hypothetical protein VFK10_01400, partial [Burkholderiaceae bacterium]|nr:hypothetical protein [Burkholderiaceae bacterium]
MLRAVALFVLWWWSLSTAQAAPVSPVVVPPAAEVEDAAPVLPKWLDPPRQLTIQLPGLSHHFDDPVDAHGQPIKGREFNERNWGLGIQIERALDGDWERWIAKTSFGVMKDSLDAMGLYAGYTWQKRIVDNDEVSMDLGGGAFLFYRTLQFDGPHLWVPGVLPVLSAAHKELRL